MDSPDFHRAGLRYTVCAPEGISTWVARASLIVHAFLYIGRPGQELETVAGEDVLHTRGGTDRITPALHRWYAPICERGRLFSTGRHHGSDPRGKPDENLSRGEAPGWFVGGCDRSLASHVSRHSSAGRH